MIERTVTSTLVLPKKDSSVEIRLTFTIEFKELEYHSLEIRVSPSLIPPELSRPLWSEFREGVNDAIWEREEILLKSSITIHMQDLDTSEPFDNFNKEEITLIARELRTMIDKSLRDILSENINS